MRIEAVYPTRAGGITGGWSESPLSCQLSLPRLLLTTGLILEAIVWGRV